MDASKTSGGSVYALAESSKCIFQIVKLLEERKLGFSFCVNKNQTLLLCGFAVLYGSIGASQDGLIVKENSKIVNEIVAALLKSKYPLAEKFKEIADTLIPKESTPTPQTQSPKRGSKQILSPKVTAAIQEGIQSIRRASSFSQAVSPRDRRKMSTKSNISDSPYRRSNPLGNFANSSRASLPPMEAARLALLEQCGPRASFVADNFIGNLDMFSWANAECVPPPATVISTPAKSTVSDSDEWEQMIAAVDHNQGSMIYGGMPTGTDNLGLSLVGPAFGSSTSSLSTVTTNKADSPLSTNHLTNTSSPTTEFDSSSLHGGVGVPWGTDSWNVPQPLNPTAVSVSSSGFDDEEPSSYFETDTSQQFLPNLVGIGNGGLDCDWL